MTAHLITGTTCSQKKRFGKCMIRLKPASETGGIRPLFGEDRNRWIVSPESAENAFTEIIDESVVAA